MGETTHFFFWHFSECQIAFISNKGCLAANRCVLGQLIDPGARTVETFRARYVEHEQGAMCTLIVMRCQRFEPLLASCVPEDNLHFIGSMFE